MKRVSCQACPLRALPLFNEHAPAEAALIESLKREQVVMQADRSIIHEGKTNAPLYTLLSGSAFRYKTLSDGRRRILKFLLAGDFIGVQQKMGDASAHGVQALTDVALCVFHARRCLGTAPLCAHARFRGDLAHGARGIGRRRHLALGRP